MGIDFIFGIVFVFIMALFLYKAKSKVRLHKILFPLVYIVQYRDSLGINAMRWLGSFKFWDWIAPIINFTGFAGMIFIGANLIWGLYANLVAPQAIETIGIVQPFFPGIPGTVFVPFLYFILSIFVIAVVHECMHGILSFHYGIRVKASGFAIVGLLVPILPAAFVEPDEKSLKRLPSSKQIAIFAAGPFANIVLALLLMGLMIYVAEPVSEAFFVPDGVEVAGFAADAKYPAELAGITQGELIQSIDSIPVVSSANLTQILGSYSPNKTISLKTNASFYTLTLAANPKNLSRAYLGITSKSHIKENPVAQEKYGLLVPFSQWFFGLLVWMFLLSLGVGLFNLLPLGPVDGGRMLHALLLVYLPKKKALSIWAKVTAVVILLIIANLVIGFIK